MTEEDVLGEIRSTFQVAMGIDNSFPFRFLQIAGGGSKSLTIPVQDHLHGLPTKWPHWQARDACTFRPRQC